MARRGRDRARHSPKGLPGLGDIGTPFGFGRYTANPSNGDLQLLLHTPGWIRTSDLRIRSPLLYPLSYRGTRRRHRRRSDDPIITGQRLRPRPISVGLSALEGDDHGRGAHPSTTAAPATVRVDRTGSARSPDRTRWVCRRSRPIASSRHCSPESSRCRAVPGTSRSTRSCCAAISSRPAKPTTWLWTPSSATASSSSRSPPISARTRLHGSLRDRKPRCSPARRRGSRRLRAPALDRHGASVATAGTTAARWRRSVSSCPGRMLATDGSSPPSRR